MVTIHDVSELTEEMERVSYGSGSFQGLEVVDSLKIAANAVIQSQISIHRCCINRKSLVLQNVLF